jgi:hypothetical protein
LDALGIDGRRPAARQGIELLFIGTKIQLLPFLEGFAPSSFGKPLFSLLKRLAGR